MKDELRRPLRKTGKMLIMAHTFIRRRRIFGIIWLSPVLYDNTEMPKYIVETISFPCCCNAVSFHYFCINSSHDVAYFSDNFQFFGVISVKDVNILQLNFYKVLAQRPINVSNTAQFISVSLTLLLKNCRQIQTFFVWELNKRLIVKI